jgi:hypothetical protein
MAPDQDYMVDAAELPTSASVTTSLSGVNCEAMLHHAVASFSCIMATCKFFTVLQYFSLLIVVLVGETETAGGLHNPRTLMLLLLVQMAHFLMSFIVGE